MNGYDPATRSEDCLTTTSLSRLFAERQGWALAGGASWFPSTLRSPERALAAGRTCYLLLRLLLVVVFTHWFGFFCWNLYGFNVVLLCNGRFWDGFAFATSASLWSRPSVDPPRGCVNEFSKHVNLHHLRIPCNLLDCYFVCYVTVHLAVCFG